MTMLATGVGEFLSPDPDAFRAYIREHKDRRLISKVMTEQEAVSRFVSDGDYLSYDLNIACRGPSSLFREVIRQKKRDLWVAAKFSWSDITLLVAGGCVSKVDVGWMETGPIINEALREGKIKLYEWSNGALAYRHLAGAMGLPFLPLRYIGGTDVFANSGAKLMEDPYTGKPICLVPALNPDIALIHVNQCDVYGNARVFGAGVSPLETAMAAKKLIISTEEIIDAESIRRQPQRTTIPYYMVDAVVVAPFGSYPGAVQGLYEADFGALFELALSQYQQKTHEYLEKWVFSVSSHEEMLENRVGAKKLMELRQAEKIREGYYE